MKPKTFYPSIKFLVNVIIILFIFTVLSYILNIKNKSYLIFLIVFDIYQWFIACVKISENSILGPNATCLWRVSISRDNALIEQAHVAGRKLKGVYKIYDRDTKRAIHLNKRYIKQADIEEIAGILNLPLPSLV